MVKISQHGMVRIRDRCGTNRKETLRLAARAYAKGLTHADTKGVLNAYITSLYFYNKTANNIRILDEKVFIFSGTTLITVYFLPKRYRKIVKKLENLKQKISI